MNRFINMPKLATVVTFGLATAALMGCSSFNELADGSPRTITTPSNISIQAHTPAPSAIDTPRAMKAKGVIKEGETTGSYNGVPYHCGNADCSIAVRADVPQLLPAAAEKK